MLRVLRTQNKEILERISTYLSKVSDLVDEVNELKTWKENFIKTGYPELTVTELMRLGKGE
jgi:hypothetical protein